MSIFPFSKTIEVFGATPRAILHGGAHLAEELEEYKSCGVEEVFWVEPNPDLHKAVLQKVGWSHCSNCALAAKPGQKVDFHRVYSHDFSNRGCSSLLEPTKMLENPHLTYVDTVQVITTTIDYLNRVFGSFDCLVMDIQGNELEALKGATEALETSIKYILTEFTEVSMYRGDCLLEDLDQFLDHFGFKRFHKEYANGELFWGDSVYVKVK
jgi:FkbM family methyltransferase